jgi:hypothetical protein
MFPQLILYYFFLYSDDHHGAEHSPNGIGSLLRRGWFCATVKLSLFLEPKSGPEEVLDYEHLKEAAFTWHCGIDMRRGVQLCNKLAVASLGPCTVSAKLEAVKSEMG